MQGYEFTEESLKVNIKTAIIDEMENEEEYINDFVEKLVEAVETAGYEWDIARGEISASFDEKDEVRELINDYFMQIVEHGEVKRR